MNGNICPILGTMLSDGPIRMISQGQELICDLDEKTLSELGIKDHQVCFDIYLFLVQVLINLYSFYRLMLSW